MTPDKVAAADPQATAARVLYNWAEGRWPGQAGLTAVEIAAQLLAHGDRIARAADYASWPGLEDE
jgi:hypothetical protein